MEAGGGGATPETTDRARRGGGPLAVLLLVVPTAVAACRAADTDGVTPVPQLLAFLPWLLLPAALALLVASWRGGACSPAGRSRCSPSSGGSSGRTTPA
ncbi:hypothetical protein [Streptomyces peucetius]|uniref:hypothetical protein n=1 Tax=Streptomyces peucetius TaxID=1950 RepID=UPI00299F57D1|nr:hypothetical protein [Streptomyces peucetius]